MAQSSLVNKFLGVLTTSEVHELIDVFRGKGRQKLTPFLEQYVKKLDSSKAYKQDELKLALIKGASSEKYSSEHADEVDQLKEAPTEKKGVLFILDSFRKTRKYQKMLKSSEVISLYNEMNRFSSEQLDPNEVQVSNRNKGVLINKKHF